MGKSLQPAKINKPKSCFSVLAPRVIPHFQTHVVVITIFPIFVKGQNLCFTLNSLHANDIKILSSANKLTKVWIQTKPDKMLGLIRRQTVWHSNGTP